MQTKHPKIISYNANNGLFVTIIINSILFRNLVLFRHPSGRDILDQITKLIYAHMKFDHLIKETLRVFFPKQKDHCFQESVLYFPLSFCTCKCVWIFFYYDVAVETRRRERFVFVKTVEKSGKAAAFQKAHSLCLRLRDDSLVGEKDGVLPLDK